MANEDYNKRIYQVFDPAVGLSLWVDEERPASCVLYDDAVLDAEVVLGQSGDVPAADLDRIAQRVREEAVLVVRDANVVALLSPAFHHRQSVLALNNT